MQSSFKQKNNLDLDTKNRKINFNLSYSEPKQNKRESTAAIRKQYSAMEELIKPKSSGGK